MGGSSPHTRPPAADLGPLRPRVEAAPEVAGKLGEKEFVGLVFNHHRALHASDQGVLKKETIILVVLESLHFHVPRKIFVDNEQNVN